MWRVNRQELRMAEGDWGIQLPITISGTEFSANDEVKLTIKTTMNGTTVLEKTFSSIIDNTMNLELTEAETALLTIGTYVYSLDWYQDGAFMCNIIPVATLKVVDKA